MAFHRVSYKQTCILCKKNKVLISSYKQKPICAECGMKGFGPVTEEPFKTLFDIQTELYAESSFLRSIRSNYHKFGSLSEKQIEVFKRVAKEMQDKKKEPVIAQPERPMEQGEEVISEHTARQERQEIDIIGPEEMQIIHEEKHENEVKKSAKKMKKQKTPAKAKRSKTAKPKKK